MTEKAAILDWLEAQEGAMIALLEALVNTDSGSYDKAGVDAVGDKIEAWFAAEGIATDKSRDTTYGDVLRATVPGGEGNRTILLMGHRDTVFPKGEPTRRPFRIEDGRAYGPGVADMKAGLVMNAFVLAAFKRFGGQPAPLVGLFTSDEEIGSPFSRAHIEAEAKRARAVFNSEPGRVSGNVVSGRKGGIFMKLTCRGKAAHSGANFGDGISAIGALAHKIVKLHALTDFDRGITVNVGLISGGQSVNTTAPEARAEIDLRFVTMPDRAEMLEKIKTIVAAEDVRGATAELTIAGEFLPLVPTPDSSDLLALYKASGAAIGLTIGDEFTGGCADSGFAANVGAPTICAVGPVGGKAHSPEEFLVVSSIVPRAKALALSILALGEAR